MPRLKTDSNSTLCLLFCSLAGRQGFPLSSTSPRCSCRSALTTGIRPYARCHVRYLHWMRRFIFWFLPWRPLTLSKVRESIRTHEPIAYGNGPHRGTMPPRCCGPYRRCRRPQQRQAPHYWVCPRGARTFCGLTRCQKNGRHYKVVPLHHSGWPRAGGIVPLNTHSCAAGPNGVAVRIAA